MRDEYTDDMLSLTKSMISSTQFNRGQAGKIFEQMQEDKRKLIVKNNKPVCVLLSIDEYERLIAAASRKEEENGGDKNNTDI